MTWDENLSFPTVAEAVSILDASTQQRSLSMPDENLASLTARSSTAVLVSDMVVIVNPPFGNQATSMRDENIGNATAFSSGS